MSGSVAVSEQPVPTHYPVEAPTLEDLRSSVQALLGDGFGETWQRISRNAGVPADADDCTLIELQRLILSTIGAGGLAGLAGRAAAIRMTTYKVLVRERAHAQAR